MSKRQKNKGYYIKSGLTDSDVNFLNSQSQEILKEITRSVSEEISLRRAISICNTNDVTCKK
ncbi:MAG: hypothetical protein RR203_07915 [Synergistaceae bacterium]